MYKKVWLYKKVWFCDWYFLFLILKGYDYYLWWKVVCYIEEYVF